MNDPRHWPWMPPLLDGARALAGAHAVLLHGSLGDGLFDAAQLVAHQWLCEDDDPSQRACGRCTGCTLARERGHPDLRRLLPEALARDLGLDEAGDEAGADGEGRARRKPSRQIRIDEVRAAIDWVATSSSRGRGKVVLIHPAEAMNLQAANALLKTLEEPPPSARLLLATPQPAQLLPTVRSRCQVLRLKPPTAAQARQWLADRGVADAEVLLAAAGGRPLEAASLAAAGIDATRWSALPDAVLAQHSAAFSGWPLAQVLDALLKLCHDGMAHATGAAPRFFPAPVLPAPASLPALAAWHRQLTAWARRADHPWNESLAVEAILQQAATAWRGGRVGSDTLVA
ncbi:MAG: DNA polymerase III subunit delta' [Rubrivivax sp.]